jgi:hypothetical protein
MQGTESPVRTFTVDFAAQVKDGLITSEDMISYLRQKMKVRNCLKIAAREIQFNDRGTSLEVVSSRGNIVKRNMKHYLKRYLRTKSLRNFVKVSGNSQDGLSLVYINAVDNAEE